MKFHDDDAPRPHRRQNDAAIPKKARERQERAVRRASDRLAVLHAARRWLRWAPGTRL